MPQPTFRGDPYLVLDVDPGASDATIKRRRRELARELHPDQAADDPERTAALTKRMARVNAAYDLLRDEDRRREYDRAHPRATSYGARARGAAATGDGTADRPSGPPPPRPTRPVTARFDTSDVFHLRDATTTNGGHSGHSLRGHPPISSRERAEEPEPLRASQPNGPVRTRRTRRRAPLPTLGESLTTELEFGKFRGHTLGQVAAFEPTYIDWIAKTITRDRDLVVKARVIQADLDDRGVERRVRLSTPGFGGGRGPDD